MENEKILLHPCSAGDNKITADALFNQEAYRNVVFWPNQRVWPDSGPEPQYNYMQTDASSGQEYRCPGLCDWNLNAESRDVIHIQNFY